MPTKTDLKDISDIDDGAEPAHAGTALANLPKPVKRLIPKPPPLTPDADAKVDMQKAMHAAEVLRAKRQAQIDDAKIKGTPADPTAVHYIECAICHGPGIFIHGMANGTIESNRWESSYKALNSYWPPSVAPHCQCCEARDGLKTPLRVFFDTVGALQENQVRVGLLPNPRFLRTLSREEYDALLSSKE